MRTRAATVLVVLLAAANLALAAAAWTRQPWANGPAEWRWQFVTADAPAAGVRAAAGAPPGQPAPAAGAPQAPTGGGSPAAPSADRWRAGGALAVALVGLGILTARRDRAAGRLALALAIACGATFTFALVALQPGGFARVVAALVSRNSFGYLWDAALAPPSRALLADYPAASEGLNQHSVTHPPGPILAVRALAWIDHLLPQPEGPPRDGAAAGPQRAPAGASGAEETAANAGAPAMNAATPGLPALAAAAVAREVERARNHRRPVPAAPPGAWSVTAFALLLPLLSALAAWPLYRLALALGCAPPTALLAALLWLLVPARSLFTPSFDQALPLPLIGAAALAAGAGAACVQPARRGRALCWPAVAAGLLQFVACFLSYGSLPMLPLILAIALATAIAIAAAGASAAATARPDGWMSTAVRQARLARRIQPRLWWSLALGFALPYLALAALGHNPVQALRAALALHRQIAVEPRSYGTWLLWNPYDFALLLSPAILGLAAMALSPRAAGTEDPPPPRCKALLLPAWTWCGLLALLWISGSVRGEVGRIWLPWMPFACLFAAAILAHRRPRGLLVVFVVATLAALTLALAGSMVFVG